MKQILTLLWIIFISSVATQAQITAGFECQYRDKPNYAIVLGYTGQQNQVRGNFHIAAGKSYMRGGISVEPCKFAGMSASIQLHNYNHPEAAIGVFLTLPTIIKPTFGVVFSSEKRTYLQLSIVYNRNAHAKRVSPRNSDKAERE